LEANVGWAKSRVAVDESFTLVVDVVFAGDHTGKGSGVGIDVVEAVSDLVTAFLFRAFYAVKVMVAKDVDEFSAAAARTLGVVAVDGQA